MGFFSRLFGRPAAPAAPEPDEYTWADRLADAVYTGAFTEDDRIAARDWATCAVGEAPRDVTGVRLIPRYPLFPRYFDPADLQGSTPTDAQLDDLGREFMHAVCDDQVGVAVDIYHDIQDRLCALAAGAEREEND
jgi:hypothetical protein